MRLQPSASSLRELQAVALGYKLISKDVRRDISKATREVLNPVWRAALASRLAGAGKLDGKVFATGARVAAGNPAKVLAATSRRPLRRGNGGLRPDSDWRKFEFGVNNSEKVSTYTSHSPKGKAYEVTRHTARGMPARKGSGRIVYPAFADVMPRMVSLWVQLIVRKFYDAYEGK
ncbi:hypothetical protein SEA_BERKA_12 [Arthrobacter phage Berka]|nr:hypothetical protein SEA_BERKA_12 [Arthrobacter phage Berka]